jgi:aspartate dehydrogenase
LPRLSIGIAGCGAIGRALLEAAADGRLSAPVAGITSRTEATARGYLATMRRPPPYMDLTSLVAAADLIVEAAGQPAVPEIARAAFAAGKDLLVISVGAMLDHPEIMEEARRLGRRLLLPSGAIAGLDGIKSACAGEVTRVSMTTRKPPGGLDGAPYLLERGISLAGLEGPCEVFSGTAREACKGFPQNVNVSAAVSLAGIGPDRTRIRILAVPGLTRNCHEIEVDGEFGFLRVQIENIPSENPRTGRLTMLSMIRAIGDAADPVRIGS